MSLLQKLESNEPLPFASAEVTAARAALENLDGATPEVVGALPEPLVQAVLDASVRARSSHLPQALSNASSKPVAKAAKRALYQLRSVGVRIETEDATAPQRTTPATEEVWPAILSSITGEGERAAVIARRVRGGYEASQIAFSDEKGLLQVSTFELGRSALRKLFADALAPPPRAIEVPLAEARAAIAEASQANLSSRSPYPAGAQEMLRHFDVGPPQPAPEIPAPLEDDARTVAQGLKLHEEPEIQPWLPSIDALRAFGLKAEEIATSRLYVSEAQRREQALHQARSSAESYFSGATRGLYARRLWAMSRYFASTGRPEAAGVAAAEARVLAHARTVSEFGVELFAKVLRLTEQLKEARAREAGAEVPPLERRSEGGLILP